VELGDGLVNYMKILLDGRFYGLENAGLGRYCVNLVRELQNIDKKNQYIILLRKKYFNKLKLNENWMQMLADFGHYSLLEQIKLPKIISSCSPDVTHFLHFNVPVFCNKRFVVTIHDILMHKQKGMDATTLPFCTYFLKRLGYKTVFRRAVIGACRVIVPSSSVKKELVNYYNLDERKVTVIYEGVDQAILQKEARNKILAKYNIASDYFIYAGNAYPHKNLSRLIEAIVLFNKRSDKKVVLVIAGSRGIFSHRLEKSIKNAEAKEYVKLIGCVTDNELGTLYENSVAFVFPSLSEGFGLPGLEAMAAGTLVLASDISVFREVYKDSVCYFNPFDFSSIEKAMREVVGMEKERRNLAIEYGKKFASGYSWSKMAKETLDIYNNPIV